ncbi:ATP-binding protein [Streptomyces sp. NRRL F-5126]|uniref:ATP-binding protein n=1 Tax=Streptomyces sp. NRRL F-5126 TaxID=1463857 RepID=UPI000B11973B|nr:ATP-binding protein [Streptomyces sp. NRRL F-5126]
MTVPLDRHYELELHASEERVPQIRRIVAAHLRHWKLDLHVRAVCRGIDELLTNVHRHVGDESRCLLEIRWSGRRLTASVEDDGPRMPRMLTAGGGLARIAALSDSWGTCATTGGKVVWFTRSVEAPLSVPRVPFVPLTLVDAELRHPEPAGPVPVAVAGTAAADAMSQPRIPTPA